MDKANLRLRRCFVLLILLPFVIGVVDGSNATTRSRPRRQAAPITATLEPVVTTLTQPIYVTNAHDGSNRLFFVEQGGIIKVLHPGSTTPTVFLNITSRVLSGGERGLLGLVFHPQFPTNRRFFVDYTRTGDGATVIAEYLASAGNPDIADTTEKVLLTISQPFANHNGGMIEFGPDGFLYIGMGDGGSGNDPGNRAQNIEELLGKILRIDVDNPNGPIPYSSPVDNPFFGATPGRDEIYAIGMRNPWRFSFDRTTDDLYVGDVGQGAREEVDIVSLGGNYAWRVFEGTLCTNLDPTLCTGGSFAAPIAEYSHTPGSGGRCSIIGGYAYRGVMSTLPVGAYVYGDLCTGEIFLLQGGVQTLLFDTNNIISSFGEDEAGELYVVELGSSVFRIATRTGPGPNDTVTLYDPAHAAIFLRNSNTGGIAHSTFTYGPANMGLIPIAGNWNGDGVDTIGLYDPAHAAFFLRNSNTGGSAEITFTYGPAGLGLVPIVGDWNGDGVDTIGLYDPANAAFFLRNSNSGGIADITFTYGPTGLGFKPIVGDWNGDGVDTVGLYSPSNAAFFLRNSNTGGIADITFTFGPAGSGFIAVAGDWNGDGTDTVGLNDPAHAAFFLRNSNTPGIADITFTYGPPALGFVPIVRDWDGL
jgi:hypothetical protein